MVKEKHKQSKGKYDTTNTKYKKNEVNYTSNYGTSYYESQNIYFEIENNNDDSKYMNTSRLSNVSFLY